MGAFLLSTEVINIAILFSQVKVQSADQSETFLISGIPKEYEDLTESVQLEWFLQDIGSDETVLMSSSTQLLVNPILGLQPKYTEVDFTDYFAHSPINLKRDMHVHKDLQISLCNLLYKIQLDGTDKKLLWKSFKKNKEFLAALNLNKKDFDYVIIETVCDMLEHKYLSNQQ